MKSTVGLFVNSVIKSVPSNSSLTISNSAFSLQMGSTENQSAMDISAKKNGISTVDFGPCESKLKAFYHIPANLSLIIQKIDYNSLTSLVNLNDTSASNSVSFSYYNPTTRDVLNSSICSTIPMKISLPVKDPSSLNLDLYHNISAKVDIFNPDSPAFNSRCVSMIDPKTGASASINYKREHYFNSTAKCAEGCIYGGIDADNYIICNCTGVTEGGDISSTFVKDTLKVLPAWNIDIIFCFKQAFELVSNNLLIHLATIIQKYCLLCLHFIYRCCNSRSYHIYPFYELHNEKIDRFDYQIRWKIF